MRFKLEFLLIGIILSGLACTQYNKPVPNNKACISIHPKTEYESTDEFNSRLQAQKKSTVEIPPKNGYESTSEFKSRLEAQLMSHVVIPPKNKYESSSEYISRLSAQKEISHKE